MKLIAAACLLASVTAFAPSVPLTKTSALAAYKVAVVGKDVAPTEACRRKSLHHFIAQYAVLFEGQDLIHLGIL